MDLKVEGTLDVYVRVHTKLSFAGDRIYSVI